jgi:hypothetical protein
VAVAIASLRILAGAQVAMDVAPLLIADLIYPASVYLIAGYSLRNNSFQTKPKDGICRL